MNKKDLGRKLLSYIDGESISDNEKTKIQDWIASDEENKTYFDLLKNISGEKRFLSQLEKVDTDKNWEKFQDTVKRDSRYTPVYSFVRRNRLYLSRIAAAVLLLVFAGTTLYFAKRRDLHDVQLVSSVNENTRVELSDGSTILLNKGSFLNYPEKLNRRAREVKLKGEAYFDIVENDASPFCVYIRNTTVKVLGTSFNIREEESGKITVSVLTGKVSFFETGKKKNSVQLETNQQGIFSSNTGKFEQIRFASENFLFWRTGKLSFVDQQLCVVFRDLEKSFGKRIEVIDSEILQSRYTSQCKGQQLDEILGELSILFNIRYSKKGDTVYIQKGR